MSCIIESKRAEGVESPLGKKLIEIYKDIDKASDVYSKLSHSSFIEKFGDWRNEDIEGRTNALGEPLLIERVGRNNAKNYFFLDKYENKLDLITNEFSSFATHNLTNVIGEITQQLGNYVFNKHIKENFNDLSALGGINLEQEILNFVDEKIKENEELKSVAEDQEDIEGLDLITSQLNNVKTHSDEFVVELTNYFKSKNLLINDEIVDDETQEALEEGLTGGDIKQSFENNTKDKATANTKLLLSFLPKYEYNIEEGDYDFKYGSLLGEQSFMNMDSIHQELLKEFTDLVPEETLTGIEDIYDLMKNKLVKLAVSKPYYNDLLELLEGLDESKINEFVVAFSHKFNNFIVSSWDSSTKTYKVINSSNQNTVDTQILNNWSKAFYNKFITEETSEVNSTYLDENNNIANKIVETTRKAFDKNLIDKLDTDIKKLADEFYKSNKSFDINNITIEEFAEKFTDTSIILENILDSIGVNISENAFRYYISNLNNQSLDGNKTEYIETVISTINSLRLAVNKLKTSRFNTKKFNLITNYKSAIFGELAKAEAFYNEDLTDTNVLANNKMYWAFSNPSYISNTVNKYKQNTDNLRNLRKQVINANSKWIDHLLGEEKDLNGDYKYDENQRAIESNKNLEAFELQLFTSFQEEGKAGEGVSNKDISETDQLIDEINKVEKAGIKNKQGNKIGYQAVYSTSTPADKPTRHEISTNMYMDDVVVSSNNQGKIEAIYSDEVLTTYKNYFLDEYNRMRNEANKLQSLEEKDYIVHYHTSKGKLTNDEGKYLGNAFKSQLFPELSSDTITAELNKELNLYNNEGLPRLLDSNSFSKAQEEIIKREISKIFNNMLRDNINELVSKRILVKGINEQGQVFYAPSGIDSRVLNEYGVYKDGTLTQSGVINLVSSYTLNSAVANVEYTKLFTGDPAMYKNMVDFFKRVPATYTDGLPLRLGMTPGDKHFNIAVIENQVVTSPYLDKIKSSLKLVGKTDKEISEITNLYNGDVNSTDAQAWITPDRWKFIMERTGKWNDNRERVYNKMIGKSKEALSYEDFKYAAQPLKGVYFGVVNGTPTYLKYSQAVIFPSLVKGSDLQNMYDSMISSNIQESITLDGIKVGAKTPNKVTNDDGKLVKTKLEAITLNNNEWKLQQDLPTKLMKPTLIGSQIQKNIFSSIDPNGAYTIGDEVINGLEMIDRLNDSLSKMSNKGIEKLSIELGLDDNNTIDKDKFYAILEDEVLDGNYSINTIKAVQKGMPLEALPGLKDKLNNMFFSKVRKAAVKVKSPGGSFIQMSNFGLDQIVADEVGVKWLVEPDTLKPPFIYKDAENKSIVQPGQIFISHSVIAKAIPGYEKMTMQEINDRIDPKLLQVIGYRIPNQGMSSNDPLQVVGILPPTMGDTIVGYTEIPTKTGSDFDIDKMYVMIPNSKEVDGKLEYVQPSDDTQAGIENELFELYWSVLTNEKTYADLITPIDFDYLKNHVKYLHGDKSQQSGENLKFYNPIFQLKLKHIYAGGKSGVGITATQLVDHNRSKHVVNLKFNNYNLGVGYIVNGETVFDTMNGDNLSEPLKSVNKKFNGTQFKISDTISAFLNAFVDNAKDPYINDGNFNTYTSGVAFMMVRAGVHPYYINSFVGQPIIKELAQFVKDYESKSTTKEEAWKSSKRVFKESYARRILNDNATDKEVSQFLARFKTGTVFSYDQLESNILNPEVDRDGDFLIDQLRILTKFDEYSDQAKKLNDSVSLSRFDTEGAGKNFIDMNITINKIKELLNKENEDGEINNHLRKYVRDGKLTSLGTQLLNTLGYSKGIIDNNDDLFLLSSEPVIDIMNEITMNTSASSGGSMGLIKDEEIGKLVSNEMYTYMLSRFPALQVEGSKLEYITNTLNDVIDYKSNQSEDVDERNFFIDSLVFYEESFGINFGNMSKDIKDQLYRSFRDLYMENQTLGNKIIKSAYHMNGFNSNLIDFRDFIPHEFFIKNDFRNFLKEQSTRLRNGEYSDDFISKFIKNNYENNKIVPVISSKRIKPQREVINNLSVVTGFSINSKDELNVRSYGIGNNNNEETMFPNFLKSQNNMLYELQGYINNDPQYKLIEKSGYKNKKSHLNIREYDVNNSEFQNDIPQAIKLANKRYNGLSKSPQFINKDLFNQHQIPKIYIKNLEDILLPQENVVSLQEDNNDLLNKQVEKAKTILKVGNEVTLSFTIKNDIVDSKVKILEVSKDANFDYSLKLENIKSGKIYDVEISVIDGNVELFYGKSEFPRIGTDTYIKELEVNNNNEESPLDCK